LDFYLFGKIESSLIGQEIPDEIDLIEIVTHLLYGISDDTEKVDALWCAFPQIPRMREDQTDTCDAEVYCLTVFSTSQVEGRPSHRPLRSLGLGSLSVFFSIAELRR
jgi:hypothetical protein